MNPARTSSTLLCQRDRSQRRNLVNARIPTTAPAINTAITAADSQKRVASAPSEPQRAPRFAVTAVMLAIMNLYFPRISRIKLPEIPGRTIAQIARAPLMNTNQRASGVWVGESVHMIAPRATPKTSMTTSLSFHPETPFKIKIDDATISPKKNAHVCIGKSERNICIRPANARILKPIPATIDRRKLPLICFQKSRSWPLRRRPTACLSILAIDPMNSS